MKLYKRLLSLLLVCFVCFGLFSVNAFAVDNENLVDSDLRNWDKISEHDIWGVDNNKIFDMPVHYSQSRYNISLNGSSGTAIESDTYGGFCELTNLTVGENYTFSIDFSSVVSSFNDYYSVYIGICYYTPDGVFYPYDNVEILYCPVSTSFTNHKLNFNYSYNGYKPYIYIIVNCNKTNQNGWWLYAKNISLTRQPSETEKKLDGILGWLEDIKNSIVGLPETIKTNFQTFFGDLENKINDFKNTVTEKFTTLSTEFSSYITNLGNNIKGFFDDFWNKISEWFEKFKPRINVDFDFQSGALNVSTGEFVFPAGNSYVLSDVIYIPDGVEMHLNYTPINDIVMRYIPVTSDGEYTGRYDQYYTDIELLLDTSRYFRIETRSYATSFIECYVDVGWFTYYMYTLRHKIDVKIEEIKQDLHDLFIPSEGYFDDLSNRFDLLIEERFGALVTITDYLVEFFSSFNADTTKEFFDVPIININLMGYNFPIGGWQVRFVPQFNGVEILTNACKFISSVLATFAFFDGLKNKYHEVFGGGE